MKGGNNVNVGITRFSSYELFNHCQTCNERTVMKYFLAIIGVIAFALAGWILYMNTPIVDLMLKIGLVVLVVLVVCAIMGAAGINPFNPEQRGL